MIIIFCTPPSSFLYLQTVSDIILLAVGRRFQTSQTAPPLKRTQHFPAQLEINDEKRKLYAPLATCWT